MNARRLAAAAVIASAVLVLAAPSARSQAPPAGHGLALEDRDTTCAPCRDFFRYANGGWIERTPVPPALASWGAAEELEERNRESLHALLEDAVAKLEGERPGTNAWKLGVFYGSCMDSARADAEGAAPLQPELARIAAIRDAGGLSAEVAALHARGIGALFAAFAQQDYRNSDQFIAVAYQGGLGLPDRDYYLKSDSATTAVRDAYAAHIARSLVLLGDDEAKAREQATDILALETTLAKASKTRVERRDPRANYHRMSVAGLDSLAPAFPWRDYFRARGVAATGVVNVAQPEFFAAVGGLVSATPIETWRVYLRWKALDAAEPVLSSAFVDEDFSFRRLLTGAKELEPRWKRCLAATDGAMGEALGQEWVKTHFPPAAKARALAMVRNLETTMRARLGRLAWMSDTTRAQAYAKLAAFHEKIGYPDKWRDYSRLEVKPGSFWDNSLSADAFEVRRNLDKIGRPVDRTEWHMTPPTVNAYYSSSMNEIVFPAGILQPPFFFFDPDADDAVNYGATGATIGHEMTHGFDDQGRKFDGRGNLRDWWTPGDAERFQARAQMVVDQFDGFIAVDSLHCNGRLTLGENVADLGGLVIAYEAFEKSLAGKPRRLLDGLTPEQRFFIAYAQSWRGMWRPERTRMLTATNPHAPYQWRTDGPLQNMPEFAKAFGCRAGDPMVRDGDLRVEIW